jgi:methylated-DNA-protein-cysteine methyltransferase-like protein
MQELTQARLFQVIHSIPKGRVATYGQVAELAGLPRAARLVGNTLKNLPKNSKLPWHRVINASGKISLPMDGNGKVQKQRLEKEGVVFLKGRINLNNYRWNP